MRKDGAPSADCTDDDEAPSFYRRWSRRKGAGRDRAQPAAAARERGGGDDAAAPRSPADAPAAVLTDADMPELDALDADSDYSGFMSEGVSEALRTRALRKLFASSQFNVLDGLDDYAEDFTSFEPLGDVVTAEMRYRLEVEAERLKARAEQEARQLIDDEPVETSGDEHRPDGPLAAAEADGTEPADEPAGREHSDRGREGDRT